MVASNHGGEDQRRLNAESPMAEKSTVVDTRLYAYLLAHEPPEHEQLRLLRERTCCMADGRMQIAPEQGCLLGFLARLIGARRVLEIGTFTGYSAMTLALALPADGRLVACDISAEWTDIGRPYWERAGVAARIDLRLGLAHQTLRELEKQGALSSFDLAFIDADKPAYDAYYEAALRLVRPGGLIALDNMLRRGRVADPDINDQDTVALRVLNAKIARDDRVDSVLLPIGPGMTLVRRRR
jgi:O-methyltransferase